MPRFEQGTAAHVRLCKLTSVCLATHNPKFSEAQDCRQELSRASDPVARLPQSPGATVTEA